MAALRRTKAGLFSVEEAHTLGQVEEAASNRVAESLLLPTDTLFRGWPEMTVSAEEERRVRNGGTFRLPDEKGLFRLYSETGEFLALASVANGECRTVKSFYEVS